MSISRYSNNPCYDVADLTSGRMDERSTIKRCLWKGTPVNCSAVFRMTPTDKGMCCTFSVDAAENLFRESSFSDSLSRLQSQDRLEALDSGRGRGPEEAEKLFCTHSI